MSLRSVNLNLIPILRALLRERNLSRAAESLSLSQPAVSAALTRLREILGDPLLFRQGRGMALTLRAHELVEPVERICTSLEDMMGSQFFEPINCARRIVIASADYAVFTVGPQLISALAEQAPNATTHFVDTPHQMLEPHAGEVDFFIVPQMIFRDGSRPTLRSTLLIQDELVTVVGAQHALAGVKEPSAEQLLAERYIAYYPGLTSYPTLTSFDPDQLGNFTGELFQGRHVVAKVQQFSLLPALALETGCAALVPRRIAEYLSHSMEVRIIETGALPVVRFDLVLAWYTANENDPSHRWFRKLIIENCTRLMK